MAELEWHSSLWAWAVAATLQATLLLAIAWLADRLLVRRVWPQLLAVLWLCALARFFLPPDLCSPLSVTRALGAPTLAAAQSSPASRLLLACFVLWICMFVALLAARWMRRARLATQIEFGLPSPRWTAALERAARKLGGRRQPRIGTLDSLQTPAVFGLWRPVLLVPTSWLERAPTVRDEHVLMHELAHLERGDLWLDELGALVRAALWFHPLVWIAIERLHALGELQCDQRVARALGRSAPAYRDTLVLAARHLALTPACPAPSGVRAFLGHPSAIIVRIENLERCAAPSSTLVRSVSTALAVALAACILPMAPRAIDLRSQAQHVIDAQQHGTHQSCFVVQAAAMVLASDPPRSSSPP